MEQDLASIPIMSYACFLRMVTKPQEMAPNLPSGIARVSHRPWPVPSRPWSVAMRWHDLLFLHWPLRIDSLRPLVPRGLEIETFEGSGWLGVVPFRMTGVRPRRIPSLPGLSAFCELNVRTYVTIGGKPGVLFFSLDAESRSTVYWARWRFHLPYYHARMALRSSYERILYRSARTPARTSAARFVAAYEPGGDPARALAGSFERWATDRYCLYACDERGGLWRGDIHHLPWPLQAAHAAIEINTMAEPLGIRLPSIPPRAHFARRLEVVAWSLERVPVVQ